MKSRTVAIATVATVVVALAGLSAFGQQYRNIEIGPVEKIQSITAGPDGTAWGLTSTSRLFFCKAVTDSKTHIVCYDERGPIKANFQR